MAQGTRIVTRAGAPRGAAVRRYRVGPPRHVLGAAVLLIALTAAIVVFIAWRGLATFLVDKVRLVDFLTGLVWRPDQAAGEGGPLVGVLPFFAGSVIVSSLAIAISAPLSLATAVFIAEIAPAWGRRILQPAIEVFVGIPSVVYGWVGLNVLVPLIRNHLGGLGFSVLAGGLVLSVMVMPTIVGVTVDALKALPLELKNAAYGLGSTRWQCIRYVLVPAARSGVLTGIVLGLARAFGETLAVQMVVGNTRLLPKSLLSPAITLTSGITMDMGYTVSGSLWNNALWSMALLLLLVTFFFIVVIRLLGRRGAVR